MFIDMFPYLWLTLSLTTLYQLHKLFNVEWCESIVQETVNNLRGNICCLFEDAIPEFAGRESEENHETPQPGVPVEILTAVWIQV